jgi:ATP-dependent exoDNAse (exonuclease V) beta subunit
MRIDNLNIRPSFSVYDASAGSGKTYTLVKEYLKIILASKRNDSYRNILAITFTNKAVHEMKRRILQNLYEFSKEKTHLNSEDLLIDISQETKLPIVEIKQKARQIVKHLLHNYASFDILTIDKFTHKVIRAFAHDLNLPSSFEVTLDTDSLLAEAIDAIISKAGEEPTITNLLLDFTIEKTDDDKSWDITKEMLDTSKLIYSENNRKEVIQLKVKTIKDFVDLKQNLKRLKHSLEERNKILGRLSLDLIISKGIDIKSFSRGTFPNHLISISGGNYRNTNKKFFQIEDVQINKAAKDRDLIEINIPQILDKLTEVYSNFEKIDFYNAFLKNITPLSLLNTVANELTRIQKEQNKLSIGEFNALIYDEIQNQPAPFIYEKLGEKYHHFFIDEFQDTSEMQWKNLIPLIDNALSSQFQSGEKGSLMIVGDPKQSIYRWRGGKAEQFIALSKDESPFNNPDKKIFHLSTNYRSYSEIIDFNNDFFKFLSREFADEDYKDLYLNHSHQFFNKRIGGHVDLTFLNSKIEDDSSFNIEEDSGKNEVYCKVTFQKIQEIVAKGYNFSDIAILTRKRDQGIQLANFLSSMNVPLISSETLLIRNSTEVQFVINVLKYLKNQNDKEAKALFLLYLATNNFKIDVAHDFVSTGLKLLKEYEFEAWLMKFDVSIRFDDLRKKSLYESTEQIISLLISNQSSYSHLHYFLDVVMERDYHKQAGISDFLVFWEENSSKYSIPSPDGSNSVKILTIHKSKGLEFPVVIFPFADEDYDKKPKDKIWVDTNEEEFGLNKALVDNTKAVENFGNEGQFIYTKVKQEELLDNINILYVALTRAEEQLYIISSFIQPRKDGEYPNNMASFFIKYLKERNVFDQERLQYKFGPLKKLSAVTTPNINANKLASVSRKFDPSRIRISQKESMFWGTYQKEALEYGNLIHEILSKVIRKTDIADAVAAAFESGLINLIQKEIVFNTISEIVHHADLEPYFSAENVVYNEQLILQKSRNMIIPDRIVMKPNNEVLLLDYKTGKYEEKHKFQLENYKNVLEKMNFEVTSKVLVYIGEEIKLIQL